MDVIQEQMHVIINGYCSPSTRHIQEE